MSKQTKLDRDIKKQLKKIYSDFNKAVKPFENRVSYILEQIGKVCENESYKLAYWERNTYDALWSDVRLEYPYLFDGNFVEIPEFGPWFDPDQSLVILANNSEICLLEGFPARWLWEDFEEELRSGRQRYLDKEKTESESKESKFQKELQEKLKCLSTAEKEFINSGKLKF